MMKNIFCVMLLLMVNHVFAQQTGILQKYEKDKVCQQWVENRMEVMSLKEKVGQLFIHTVAPLNTEANRKNIEDAVKEYKIGGLLFSGGEIRKQMILQNYAQSMAKVPLLITFDGEWGAAMRLKHTPSFPKSRVLGCIANDTLLYEYGREVAREFKAMGVHVNFAPVADVDNNPNNPVINYRSFGSIPHVVARKVVAYSKGLEDGGVLAVCKHFPGHGDTNVDSHKALPTLMFDRSRLDSVELVPFRQAFQAGIGGVMVGHLYIPSLSKVPASVSPEIINGLLRKELGFRGMSFTDALEMKGIADNAPLCANALIAGNDMILAPRNLKRELDGVMDAIRKGRLSKKEIEEKCRKVLTYKYALMYGSAQQVKLEGIEERVSTKSAELLIEKLQKAALTVVNNKGNILPLRPVKTALLAVSETLSESAPLHATLKEHHEVTWIHAKPENAASIYTRLKKVDQVVMAIYVSKLSAYRPMLEKISKEKPVVLVLLNDIKRLNDIKVVARNARSVVLAHYDKDYIQKHAGRVLTGKEKADGQLSVDIEGVFSAGMGVQLHALTMSEYTPELLGMDAAKLSRIDSIALEGIDEGAYPGCRILITRRGIPVYDKCFGKHTYEGNRRVEKEDIYDIASMSKATGTLLAVMKLYDEGKFSLADKASRYLPYLQNTDKKNITIQQLLFHESGIMPYYPFYRYAVDMEKCGGKLFAARKSATHPIFVDKNTYAPDTIPFLKEVVANHRSDNYPCAIYNNMYITKAFSDTILHHIADSKLLSHRYRYSCLNFMLLKDMIERMTHTTLDHYLDSVFFVPMGLNSTMYNPLGKVETNRIVPTVAGDFLRKGEIRGYVHDEAAAFLGGVSGNAGLFSDVYDVAKIFQMYLDGGILDGRRYVSETTCRMFTTKKSALSRRGLGFDKPETKNPKLSPCAEEASAAVFGHTGFTGTCVWADPQNDLIFIFLSNRTYPVANERKKISRLNIRTRMQQAMYQALMK